MTTKIDAMTPDGGTEADAGQVIICPICGHVNPIEATHCGRCWRRRLGQVGSVSAEEGERFARAMRSALRRKRLARWGIVLGVIFGLIAWRLFDYFDPFLSLPTPQSTLAAIPGPGEWAMYQRDPTHSAFSPEGGFRAQGEVKWSFVTDEPLNSAPAVVGGRVYLGTGDGRVVALEQDSGEMVWEYLVGPRLESSLAVAGNIVFVGHLNGEVLALNKDTGRLLWEFSAGDRVYHRIFSSPAVHDGTVYIGSGDGRLYALDAVTGKERWSYQTNDAIISSPAVNDEVVAVLSQDKHLYIFDLDTGKKRLDYRTFFANASPTIYGDSVLWGDDQGFVRAVDWHAREYPFEKAIRTLRFHIFWYGFADLPGQKGLLWGFQNPARARMGTPVAAEGKLYAASTSGTLFALNADTGAELWDFPAGSSLIGPPAVAGDTVFVGDSRGRLWAVDATDGTVRWWIDTGGSIETTPVVAGGSVYVASTDGTLYAIDS